MKLKPRTYILSTIAGIIFVIWLFYTPPGLLGKADAIGYAVCHQMPSHSFHIMGRPIALCARCTGQYLGAALALVYAGALGKRRSGWPNKKLLALLGIFVLAYSVDGVNSLIHSFPDLAQFSPYQPHNTIRLLTGSGMGLVIGLGAWHIFQEVIWKNGEDGPVLSGFWQWSVLFLLTLVVDGFVLTGNPLFLYPLTLVSAFSVLSMLTLLYTLIWVIIFRVENSFECFHDFIWLLALGFITATLQIGLLDYIRYFFTGTWAGFHLG